MVAAAPSGDDGARYYQREALEAVEDALVEHRSALVRMATGLGKTRLVSALIRRWPGRVLFLAHRDELLEQARAELRRATGEWVDLEKAEFRGYQGRIVVASVQTLSRESEDAWGVKHLRRLEQLERLGGRFSLVVIDEAHRAVAPSYRKLFDAMPEAQLVGVTATTDRLDKRATGIVFDAACYDMGIWDGIDAGFLVPLEFRHHQLDSIDLRGVRSSKSEGGLNLGDLDEAMVRAVEHITQDTIRLEPDRQGVAFFPGVRSAQYAADRFNALRPGSAICITGNTDPVERRLLTRQFKRGEYLYLCNCQVATEGFDAPTASMVILGRPTKSRALLTQMVGRCTRVLPGVVDHLREHDQAGARRRAIEWSDKPGSVVLDFVGMMGKHKLQGPIDMLGGDYTEAEVKRAKEIAEKKGEEGETYEVRETLEQARAELRAIAAAVKAKVRSRVTTVDPFEVFGTKLTGHGSYGKVPASDAQLRVIRQAGIKDTKGLTKAQAQKLCNTIFMRKKLRLCSFKQLAKLQEFGIQKKNITAARARKALDYLSETRWGKATDLDTLQQIVEG